MKIRKQESKPACRQAGKQIHVVHIIPSLHHGGAERVLVTLINNSSPAFRHSVITLFDLLELADDITKKDVEITVVPKRGKLSMHLLADLERALRKLQPDIVQTHLSGGDIWGRIAARRLGVPIISRQANVARDLGFFRNTVMRLLRKKADQYIACSTAVKKSIARAHNINPEKITVIYNSVSEKRFASVTSPQWKEPISFLLLGRLVRQKGVDIALRACAQLKDRFAWRATIVGEGEEQEKLMRMVRDLGLQEQVTFRPPTTEVPQLFQEHDLVLMPSRWEGFGVVALEAMASARTLIASRVDGLAEFVQHKKNGFLIEPENADALAAQIQWCLEHKKECIAIGKQARTYVADKFSPKTMAQAYEKVYLNLL